MRNSAEFRLSNLSDGTHTDLRSFLDTAGSGQSGSTSLFPGYFIPEVIDEKGNKWSEGTSTVDAQRSF